MRERLDLTGQKFGRLTATLPQREGGKTRWLCRCECGKEVSVGLTNLRSGKTKSCGCLHLEELKMRALDLSGQRFGSLTVVSRDEERTETRKVMWKCICDCGNESSVQTNNLRSGNTVSCGSYVHRSYDSSDFDSILRKTFERYKSRGFHFDLTKEEFIALCTDNCHYCGSKPMTDTFPGRPKRNGIDRKEPSIGYVSSNCVSCCWVCNRMKGVMTYESFIEYAKLIAARM